MPPTLYSRIFPRRATISMLMPGHEFQELRLHAEIHLAVKPELAAGIGGERTCGDLHVVGPHHLVGDGERGISAGRLRVAKDLREDAKNRRLPENAVRHGKPALPFQRSKVHPASVDGCLSRNPRSHRSRGP